MDAARSPVRVRVWVALFRFRRCTYLPCVSVSSQARFQLRRRNIRLLKFHVGVTWNFLQFSCTERVNYAIQSLVGWWWPIRNSRRRWRRLFLQKFTMCIARGNCRRVWLSLSVYFNGIITSPALPFSTNILTIIVVVGCVLMQSGVVFVICWMASNNIDNGVSNEIAPKLTAPMHYNNVNSCVASVW